jgi:LPS-assembly lipoprotein
MDLKRLLAPVGAAALAGLLCACSSLGFQPLYATPGLTPSLESIQVVVPQNRAGFMLKEKMDDAFARKVDQAARYRLNLTLAERRNPRGLRVNNVASDVEEDLNVSYELVENATGKSLLKGFVPASVFYVSADAPYAGIAAQQDAQARAADQVAVRIRLDLSRYFARQAAKASEGQ